MAKSWFLPAAAAALLILGFTALATPTQQAEDLTAPAANAPVAVALLDVAYIFKNYPPLIESMAQMKTDVDAAEAEVKHKKEALEDMQRQLKLLAPGTPTYGELEKRITMGQAELAGSIEAQKKAFLRREARLYYDTYEAISQAVGDYARANHVAIVIRFSGDAVNVNEPNDVLQHINRPVVWHDQGRDLTRIILQRLICKPQQPEQPHKDAPEEPAKPPRENDHGESQRPSHLG